MAQERKKRCLKNEYVSCKNLFALHSYIVHSCIVFILHCVSYNDLMGWTGFGFLDVLHARCFAAIEIYRS